jgi:hypothetical protein
MCLNHHLKISDFSVITTTEESNILSLKNGIFLQALVPLTPLALMKGASRDNILNN